MNIRSLLRRYFYTQNTVRYRVEWRCMESAWQRIGKSQHLFDGGAGSGEFARKAMASGFADRVTALEYDPGNFSRLTDNLGRYPNTILRQGSLLEVPFVSESFDVVQCTQVLEHLVEHEQAAAELARVLKPGGHAIITVPHPPEPYPNEGHVREGYTEKDLQSLFSPHGFEPLLTDWFLTRRTVNRMLRADRLPLRGAFLPVTLMDCEKGLTLEERRNQLPFGILTLFRKAA
jgi:ubiquinone/menaquinone biosynthesis C-methylase UbiE